MNATLPAILVRAQALGYDRLTLPASAGHEATTVALSRRNAPEMILVADPATRTVLYASRGGRPMPTTRIVAALDAPTRPGAPVCLVKPTVPASTYRDR